MNNVHFGQTDFLLFSFRYFTLEQLMNKHVFL